MKLRILLFCAAALCAGTSLQAVTLFQTDTFDSSVQNWAGGANPTQVVSGGPAGSGDGYLMLSQTDFHLATRNQSQWQGDYTAAGIARIEVDLNSFTFTDTGSSPNGFGPAAPLMYLMLRGPGGDWTSSSPFSLTVGGGWQHAVFGLTAVDLTYLSGGTGVLDDTLSDVTRLLLTHDYVVPTVSGDHPPHVSATLGIDNITAIPEPSSLGLLALFALAGVGRRRRS